MTRSTEKIVSRLINPENEKFPHLVHAMNVLSHALWSCVPDAMQTTCCSVNNISVLSHHGTFPELTPVYERQR